MHRGLCASMVFVLLGALAGCGESKPDPTQRPGFVDTSADPTAIGMPPGGSGPPSGGPIQTAPAEGAAPAGGS